MKDSKEILTDIGKQIHQSFEVAAVPLEIPPRQPVLRADDDGVRAKELRELRREGGTGSCDRTCSITSCAVAPANGGRPERRRMR